MWVGQTLSQFGSGISQIAYPLLVLNLTGSPAVAGLVSAARAVPFVFLGLPAGAFVDRWNRRKAMIISDSVRAINMATIPVALALGVLTVGQLIANAFVGGVCYVFFSAAEETSLPNIVGSGQLTAAVSAQETSTSASGVLAPSLGGSLLSIFQSLPFIADGLSYLISVIFLSFVRTPFRQGGRLAQTRRLLPEIIEGLRWLWRQPAIRRIAITAAGLQIAATAARSSASGKKLVQELLAV